MLLISYLLTVSWVKTVEWARQDSNLRRLSPADLQSAPFATRDTDPCIIHFLKLLDCDLTQS